MRAVLVLLGIGLVCLVLFVSSASAGWLLLAAVILGAALLSRNRIAAGLAVLLFIALVLTWVVREALPAFDTVRYIHPPSNSREIPMDVQRLLLFIVGLLGLLWIPWQRVGTVSLKCLSVVFTVIVWVLSWALDVLLWVSNLVGKTIRRFIAAVPSITRRCLSWALDILLWVSSLVGKTIRRFIAAPSQAKRRTRAVINAYLISKDRCLRCVRKLPPGAVFCITCGAPTPMSATQLLREQHTGKPQDGETRLLIK